MKAEEKVTFALMSLAPLKNVINNKGGPLRSYHIIKQFERIPVPSQVSPPSRGGLTTLDPLARPSDTPQPPIHLMIEAMSALRMK